MGTKEALRELQGRLAERLQAVRREAPQRSWLAVEVARRGFLLPLAQAGEISGVPAVVPVPHTVRWFLGVANLRGALVGVVDLAALFGVSSTGERPDARLVALNPALEVPCALLVDRLAGLRSESMLQPETADDATRPGFLGQRFRDAQGRLWQELVLSALAVDPTFRRIAA
jgi:twitching motility protein PilI